MRNLHRLLLSPLVLQRLTRLHLNNTLFRTRSSNPTTCTPRRGGRGSLRSYRRAARHFGAEPISISVEMSPALPTKPPHSLLFHDPPHRIPRWASHHNRGWSARGLINLNP